MKIILYKLFLIILFILNVSCKSGSNITDPPPINNSECIDGQSMGCDDICSITPLQNDACGDCGGDAYSDPNFGDDDCTVNSCVGGNSGKTACIQDCKGDWGGTATNYYYYYDLDGDGLPGSNRGNLCVAAGAEGSQTTSYNGTNVPLVTCGADGNINGTCDAASRDIDDRCNGCGDGAGTWGSSNAGITGSATTIDTETLTASRASASFAVT